MLRTQNIYANVTSNVFPQTVSTNAVMRKIPAQGHYSNEVEILKNPLYTPLTIHEKFHARELPMDHFLNCHVMPFFFSTVHGYMLRFKLKFTLWDDIQSSVTYINMKACKMPMVANMLSRKLYIMEWDSQ